MSREPIHALLVAIASVLLLAGCADDAGPPEQPTTTAANGEVYNEADLRFATEMIQHHAEALAMVDLTRGRELSPEVTRLAEEILAAQGPEIELMAGWLTGWDQPVPETVRDHANAHGHGDEDGSHGSDVPGQDEHAQLGELEAAHGAEFERLWLERMIEHHDGAVEMAREERSEGAFAPAVELAGAIEAAQQEQVEQMEDLLSPPGS